MPHKYWAMALVAVVGTVAIAGVSDAQIAGSISLVASVAIWNISEWWK